MIRGLNYAAVDGLDSYLGDYLKSGTLSLAIR
jgi:hypothetical protein